MHIPLGMLRMATGLIYVQLATCISMEAIVC